jgi:membrane protease YdiL (CAAX protease family)
MVSNPVDHGAGEVGAPTVTDAPDTATPGGGIAGLVRRHPQTSFWVLACALSWWPGLLYLAGASPVPMAGFGPFLAAVVVLALTRGRPGLGRLFRSMVRWRVPILCYVAALGLPVLISGAAVLATLASGAPAPPASAVATWTDIPVSVLLILLIPGLGGAWEEPGFRGYALGGLERRYGFLLGPLVLGVLWVGWHLPLFLAGQILWPDVLVIIAASVVIAAVFHSARDSVLIAMILHATNNAVGGGYASQLFEGRYAVVLGVFTAIGWWLAAGAIMWSVARRGRASSGPLPVVGTA